MGNDQSTLGQLQEDESEVKRRLRDFFDDVGNILESGVEIVVHRPRDKFSFRNPRQLSSTAELPSLIAWLDDNKEKCNRFLKLRLKSFKRKSGGVLTGKPFTIDSDVKIDHDLLATVAWDVISLRQGLESNAKADEESDAKLLTTMQKYTKFGRPTTLFTKVYKQLYAGAAEAQAVLSKRRGEASKFQKQLEQEAWRLLRAVRERKTKLEQKLHVLKASKVLLPFLVHTESKTGISSLDRACTQAKQELKTAEQAKQECFEWLRHHPLAPTDITKYLQAVEAVDAEVASQRQKTCHSSRDNGNSTTLKIPLAARVEEAERVLATTRCILGKRHRALLGIQDIDIVELKVHKKDAAGNTTQATKPQIAMVVRMATPPGCLLECMQATPPSQRVSQLRTVAKDVLGVLDFFHSRDLAHGDVNLLSVGVGLQAGAPAVGVAVNLAKVTSAKAPGSVAKDITALVKVLLQAYQGNAYAADSTQQELDDIIRANVPHAGLQAFLLAATKGTATAQTLLSHEFLGASGDYMVDAASQLKVAQRCDRRDPLRRASLSSNVLVRKAQSTAFPIAAC